MGDSDRLDLHNRSLTARRENGPVAMQNNIEVNQEIRSMKKASENRITGRCQQIIDSKIRTENTGTALNTLKLLT